MSDKPDHEWKVYECLKAGCFQLVKHGRRYCPDHDKPQRKRGGGNSRRGRKARREGAAS